MVVAEPRLLLGHVLCKCSCCLFKCNSGDLTSVFGPMADKRPLEDTETEQERFIKTQKNDAGKQAV
jgi:hypothetical protein